MTDNGQEYIPVETVASILRVSVRHASRFADRVRTERAGKRILFHRGDVEELAREIGADNKPLVPPLVELVPAGEMLASFEQQQQQLVALSHEVGRLQGIVEGQKALVEGYQQMQERVR